MNNILILFFIAEYKLHCDGCGKCYRQKGSLYKHKKYECGKNKSFSCYFDGCNYKAHRKDTLKTHLIRHGHRDRRYS